jgi:hypothetical protein
MDRNKNPEVNKPGKPAGGYIENASGQQQYPIE